MAKLTLSDITNTSNSSIAATVNTNNNQIESALENTLSRDGTSPNSMSAQLDMNSNAIINLPEPTDSTEPVRLGDLQALANGSTFDIEDLLDVNITDPQDDDFLRYDSATEKWVNEQAAGAGNAPDDVDYLVKTASDDLTSERVVADSTSVVANWDTSGQVEFRRAALTGDVTASVNSNATTIADEAVTLAKMAHVATDRILGRDTTGTGDVEALTVGGGLEFTGSGGIQRSALTGDVTASAGSNSTTISAGAVDLDMMANLAEDRIIGRISSGTGVPEALTGTQVGSLISIDDLSDVDITTPGVGDVLQYDGSDWVNSATGSFGAPSGAEYIVNSASAGLSAERVLTNTDTITWDDGTSAQIKANLAQIPVTFVIACSDETTALEAATAVTSFRMPHAMTLTAVRASLTTAQTGDGGGGIFTVDINEDTGGGATSILSTKLTIDNSEKTSTTADAAAVISDASLADDSEITIDIDQIGDGTATGLKVTLIGTRTV